MFKTMKNIIYLGIIILSFSVNADYIIKYQAPEPSAIKFVDQQGNEVDRNWTEIESIYSDWVNDGLPYDCMNWSPSADTVNYGDVFTQNSSDCKLDQTRTIQRQESQNSTGEIRNKGSLITERTTLTAKSHSREQTGTMETWVPIVASYSDWIDFEELYDCTNWTPDVYDIDAGVEFEQTATDCKQDQTRSRQDREQGNVSFEIRDVGEPIEETQTLTDQENIRDAVGVKALGYTHFRIFIEVNNGAANSQIVELELLNASGVDLFDLHTVTSSQSSYYTTSYKADKTFDNLFGSSKWTTAGNQQSNSWVSYVFPTGVLPKTLTITNFDNLTQSTRQPRDFQVQFSTDNGVTWTTLKRFTGATGWTVSEKRSFSLTN